MMKNKLLPIVVALWAAMLCYGTTASAQARITRAGVDSIVVPAPKHSPAPQGDAPERVKDLAFNYEYFCYEYQSVDQYGDTVTLSALAALPYSNSTSVAPQRLIIGCHATITDNAECPSAFIDSRNYTSDVGMILAHANAEVTTAYGQCMVILPDYLGYGVSADRSHPYLIESLTARNVVDGVRAGLALMAEGGPDLEPREFATTEWKSVAVGYSQGGAVAMAVHRFIEENGLSDELHFAGSVCGDGPYDLLATMHEYIANDRVDLAVVTPLILKGMLDASPLLRHRKLTDYLSEDFLATGVIDMIATKQYSTGDIARHLLQWTLTHPDGFQMMVDGHPYTQADNTGDAYARISDMMRPDLLQRFQDFDPANVATAERDAAIDLWLAMESNSLVSGWQPKHRIVLFHSVTDEVVPYCNAQQFLNAMPKSSYIRHVRYAPGDPAGGLHVASGVAFFMKLGGASPEQEAIERILGTAFSWNTYGRDSWD